MTFARNNFPFDYKFKLLPSILAVCGDFSLKFYVALIIKIYLQIFHFVILKEELNLFF